jgi:hypothetical protein
MRKLTEEDLDLCEDIARTTYRQHQGAIRGQQLTAADSPSWHVYQSIMDKMLEVNRADVGVVCLEKMRTTMTRLGLATDASVEAFGADLEGQIYSILRSVDSLLAKINQQDALDAARYRWLSAYLVGPQEDYDVAIVAAKTIEEFNAVVDAAMEATL